MRRIDRLSKAHDLVIPTHQARGCLCLTCPETSQGCETQLVQSEAKKSETEQGRGLDKVPQSVWLIKAAEITHCAC